MALSGLLRAALARVLVLGWVIDRLRDKAHSARRGLLYHVYLPSKPSLPRYHRYSTYRTVPCRALSRLSLHSEELLVTSLPGLLLFIELPVHDKLG